MKKRMILCTLVTLFAAAVVCFAAVDLIMGTWKLNEAKSKISPGAAKNVTGVYAAIGDSVKVTVDGVDANGKPAHNEWTGKFDGKDYPITGDPTADTRAYTRVDDHTLTFTNKKGGNVALSGRIVISPDGKSRTVTSTGTDAKGNKISSTTVYDRQ